MFLFVIMDEFQKQIETLHYIALSNDGTCNTYSSLRTMATNIQVDFSTISKKLKSNEGLYCYCTSKGTGTIYYIKRIH